MKKIFLFLFLIASLSCQEEPNIFDDITSKGGFILFETDLDPLHDILGDETVVDINVTDPNNNAASYSVVAQNEDGTITDIVATVNSFPGNLVIKRSDVLSALGLSSAEELPQNVRFFGIVTTKDGVIISGQDVAFNSNTNESTGGNTFYDGLGDIPRQAMKFDIVMFQLISPNEVASFFISSGDDDVEEIVAENGAGGTVGAMSIGSSDLEIGELSGGQGLMAIGLRFNFVGLPQGATISSAKIQFQADNIGANPVEITIYGENTANSEPFENVAQNLTSRNFTSANVVWDVPEWVNVGDRGAAQLTVDFSNILQEIVNRADWIPGNSITIILMPTGDTLNVTSTSGGREAEAGVGDDSAELILSYN